MSESQVASGERLRLSHEVGETRSHPATTLRGLWKVADHEMRSRKPQDPLCGEASASPRLPRKAGGEKELQASGPESPAGIQHG